MGKVKYYTCSSCGRKGHNKKGCWASRTASPAALSPMTRPREQLRKLFGGEETRGEAGGTAGETRKDYETSPRKKNLTFEELASWWELYQNTATTGSADFPTREQEEMEGEQLVLFLTTVPPGIQNEYSAEEWEDFLRPRATPNILAAVLKDRRFPENVRKILLSSPYEDTVLRLVPNPNTTEPELERILSEEPSWRLLRDIARHPNATEKVLKRILGRQVLANLPAASHSTIICSVLSHPNCPEKVIDHYSHSSDARIRATAEQRRKG